MGFGMGLLAVGAAAGAAIITKFLADELSDEEIRQQRRMLDEYDAYERERRRAYAQTCMEFERAFDGAAQAYAQQLERYRQEQIQRRKEANRTYYNNRIELWNKQREEKRTLLEECRKIIAQWEAGEKKQQHTYLRFKATKMIMISMEEASYKLEAYLEYLDIYKGKLEKEYNDSGELIEPFSMILPKEYPYEGQLLYLSPKKFKNGGYVFDELGYVRLDQSDEGILKNDNSTDECPFLLTKSGKGKKYLSYTKGILKRSIGGTIGIDVEIKELRKTYILLSFMGNEHLRMSISRRDLLNGRRKTPVGSNLHVYVAEYDFALKKNIRVSQKVEDGLTMAAFESIPMIQSEEGRREFYSYLEENNLLDYEDEWRIAPVWNDKKDGLSSIIMQVAAEYAFEAEFVEFPQGTGKTVLKYYGMLDKESFVSFDDVFVTTNVTVDVLTERQVEDNIDAYEDMFQECQKLQIYLVTEFIKQNRMMINTPMNVYLNQWTEVTNRLIEQLSVGKEIAVSVCEYENIYIMKECYTYLYADNVNALRRYLEGEEKEGRTRYYLQYTEYEKMLCKIQLEEDQIVIKMKGKIQAQDLLERNFVLELCSIANPYAEKQHIAALDSFREGRVVNTEIKNAIINIADEQFEDNGLRIPEFYNQGIYTNEAQAYAVVRAFAEKKLFMIQGPPGTGKTTVIKEIILQQLRQEEKSRILVVSQANVAVDNVLRGIIEIIQEMNDIEAGQIVRCGAVGKIAEDLVSYSFENKLDDYWKQVSNIRSTDETVLQLNRKWLDIISDKNNEDIVGECLLGCFQIIGATCVGLENRHYGLSGIDFDLVIIDEAGKALSGELLIPINRAKKLIVIGDHKQLPPVINPALYKGGKVVYDDVVEDEKREDFLNKSFFQRLYEACPDQMKGMLRTQFRMPPVIADLVNMFYDGQLLTGENCYRKEPIFFRNNLIMIDMKRHKDYVESQDTFADGRKSSPYNKKEAEVIQHIIKKIRVYYKRRIVIITPYKRQKHVLVKALKEAGISKNVWVNTIDAFQGDEENIVIFCTTRSKRTTEYFSDSARLNVAFSRAKNTLIILGNSRYFKKYRKDHILYRISEYLESHACCIDYSDFMSEDLDMKYNDSYLHMDTNAGKQQKNMQSVDLDHFLETVTEKPAVQKEERCEACKKILKDEEEILCSNCLKKKKQVKCKCCKKPIWYSNYEHYVKKQPVPTICEECRQVEVGICKICGKPVMRKASIVKKYSIQEQEYHTECKNKVYETRTCKVCGKPFDITYREKIFFEEKGFKLPRTCKQCRDAKRKG